MLSISNKIRHFVFTLSFPFQQAIIVLSFVCYLLFGSSFKLTGMWWWSNIENNIAIIENKLLSSNVQFIDTMTRVVAFYFFLFISNSYSYFCNFLVLGRSEKVNGFKDRLRHVIGHLFLNSLRTYLFNFVSLSLKKNYYIF